MDLAELEGLLEDLRAFGADHQTVEAKRARTGLPETVQESLIAMANAEGGVVLLGVDENNGAFDVTGVEDAGRVMAALQAACAELEPPLRPRIGLIEHPDGTIVTAEFPAVPRSQRPCHRRVDGPHASSFVRVGDADQRLDSAEVDEMLAERTNTDYSRRAHGSAVLDDGQVRALADRALRDLETVPALLRRYGALGEDDVTTVAGVLALGANPATESAAARIAYRRAPGPKDPPGTRQHGEHLEGRVGELLNEAMNRLQRDLPAAQVQRGGRLVDEHEVPLEALREIVANALMHRSLTASRESASVAIEVSEAAVVITSPGGLHVAAEPSQLGLSPLSSVRNLALVRICEQLRTPIGDRIVENQASGIKAADVACRGAGTMPPLFVDQPTSFQVYLLRGALDVGAARRALTDAGMADDADANRIVAAALRLQDARQEEAGSPLARIALDARFAARLLSPCSLADAGSVLRRLEDAGVLSRRRSRRDPSWVIRTDPAVSTRHDGRRRRAGRDREKVDAVVLALAGSDDGELGRAAIGLIIDRSSSKTVVDWINAAIDAGFVEPTRENPYDPRRAYRLTGQGRAYAEGLAGG
jgi:ATP-dependent DNA helicase RecG